jgi:Sulfatase
MWCDGRIMAATSLATGNGRRARAATFGDPRIGPEVAAGKPSTQYFSRLFQTAVWGGVADDASQAGYAIEPYPRQQTMPYGIGTAPFAYWQRSLDCYTHTMSIVDQRVGEVLAALPRAVADNTITVFSSDHGEFAGAHCFVAGKAGSVYDEAYHVPLIVVDPTGRFAGDIGVCWIRYLTTSSRTSSARHCQGCCGTCRTRDAHATARSSG